MSSISLLAQIDENYRENLKNAFAASSADECQSSLKFCNEVLKSVPNHPVINYLTARLNAHLGNDNTALEQLNRATKLGYITQLPYYKVHHLNDPAFIKLRGKIEFKQIIKILEKPVEQIHKSEIAFTINDKELNPEEITYDPIEKMFYLGSIGKHKIIKIDLDGKCTDFIKKGQDGINTVLGIHFDPLRRTLWAVSSPKGKNKIFKYNIKSGKLIKQYPLPTLPEGIKHWFNDLVILPNGDIYISGGSSIYRIPHSSDKLELFLQNNSFVALNGITSSDDEKTIYVADYLIGLYKVDLETKSFSLLIHEENFNTLGIDGLYYLDKQLFAVQDILIPQISRFSMNKSASHIERCEVFERNSPYLIGPTTGVIVDNFFYFITDPQGKGKNGIIIMKTPLKNGK